MWYKIGVDVGGTNTDAAVLDDQNNLVGAYKSPTTPDVTSGIQAALDGALRSVDIDVSRVRYVMLGTTQCTNAIIERKHLARIGVIRIGAPAAGGVEPLYTWPADLREVVGDTWRLVRGGYEYDGRLISDPVDREEILRVADEFVAAGVESIAVSCIFSPVNSDHETLVGDILRERLGDDFPITLSHQIGSIGLLERENSAALNAALVRVARLAAEGLTSALERKNISARVFFAQNDGTLMSLDYARRYPIFTIASGPTNSIRGAAFLSGLDDCVVMDVGGTSTDVGILVGGFPRQSAVAVEIGGVRTNFRMPDILSVGLGGGSLIRKTPTGVTIGPDSVGYQLTRAARAWGGETLTATDVLLWTKRVTIDDPACDRRRITGVDAEAAEQVMDTIRQTVEQLVERIKTSHRPLPVVLAGGGSILVPDYLNGASEVLRPRNYQYANAIGAAIAQVSGEVDRMWSLDKVTRQAAVAEAKDTAVQQAVEAGADPDTVEIVDMEEIPLSYLPGNVVRIKVKAAGNLQMRTALSESPAQT